MLHYDPQHVSSSTLLVLRRTNFITTASGIVTLCKEPYSMQLSTCIPYGCLQSVTIPEAVIIQFFPPEDEQGTARNMLRIVM